MSCHSTQEFAMGKLDAHTPYAAAYFSVCWVDWCFECVQELQQRLLCHVKALQADEDGQQISQQLVHKSTKA